MDNKLADDRLKRILPALSLLAEDLNEKASLGPNSLREILLSVDADHEAWAHEELALWLQILDRVKRNPNQLQKDATITELKHRGIPEFPAMLAVYVVTNQQMNTTQVPAHARSLSAHNGTESIGKPAEPYHKLLPDHGWHNDITWEQLPDWIKRNPQLIARLKHGEEVVGKNVRYRFVANRLIRRLR